MCRGFCLALGRSTLLFLDVVDGCAGAFCLGYSIWLHHTLAKPADAEERHKLAWSVITTVVLGSMLCLTSLASLVAVTFGEACGGLLLLSGFSGLLLGVFELCLLFTFGALKGTSLEFMEAHKADFGLNENGVETFKNMYIFLLWVLGGLVVAEVVRFRLSGHLRRELQLDSREARDYRERLLEVEASEAGRRREDREARRKELEEKYKQKRRSYIERYKGGDGSQQQQQQGGPALQLNEEDYLDV